MFFYPLFLFFFLIQGPPLSDQAPDAAKRTGHANELELNSNEIDHHKGHGKKSLIGGAPTTDSNVLKELITKLVDLIDENDDGMTKNETQQFIERLDKKIQRENQRGKRAAPPPPEVGRVCAEWKDAKNVLRHRFCTDEKISENLTVCQEKDGNKLCFGVYEIGKICAHIDCTLGYEACGKVWPRRQRSIRVGAQLFRITVCTDQKDATKCDRGSFADNGELCVITETETKGARACREAKGGDKQRAVQVLRTGLQALFDAADADNDAKMTRQELELLWAKKEQGPLIWNVDELNLQLELIKCGLDGLGLSEWFQLSKLGAKKGAGGASMMMTKEQIRAKIFGTN